jgi:hypothetical protein
MMSSFITVPVERLSNYMLSLSASPLLYFKSYGMPNKTRKVPRTSISPWKSTTRSAMVRTSPSFIELC